MPPVNASATGLAAGAPEAPVTLGGLGFRV